MIDQRMIRAAKLKDAAAIQDIAVDTGMFTRDDVGFLGEMLAASFRDESPGAQWLVVEDEDVIGAAYYAPEPFADRMWNLYFIAVAPQAQGSGIGKQLMHHIESALQKQGESVARTLIVETSSTPMYERTRAFYKMLGYAQEARIRQFYGPTDDKIVFWKSLLPGEVAHHE